MASLPPIQPIEPNPTRVVTSVAVALAGEVPGLGAAVALFVDRVRERREKELQQFLHDVAERINHLLAAEQASAQDAAARVERYRLDEPEFTATLAKAAEEAIREPDPHKREYLLRYVTASARDRTHDLDLQTLFWQYVRGMTGMHALLLSELYARQKHVGLDDLRALASMPERSELVSVQAAAARLGISARLLAAITVYLRMSGLMRDVDGPAAGNDRGQRLLLEPLGLEFMRFLERGIVLDAADR